MIQQEKLSGWFEVEGGTRLEVVKLTGSLFAFDVDYETAVSVADQLHEHPRPNWPDDKIRDAFTRLGLLEWLYAEEDERVDHFIELDDGSLLALELALPMFLIRETPAGAST